MIELLKQFLNYNLGIPISDDFTIWSIAIFLIVSLAVLVFRIIVALSYQGQYAIFKVCAKDIKNIKEVKETKSGILNKCMRDYIRLSERGVSNVSTASLVSNIVGKGNFLGISLKSLENFVSGMEMPLLLSSLILAMVFDNKEVFAIMGIASFVILKLFSAIFDFIGIREKLTYELIEYLEREVGQYYSTSVSTTIQMLKLEIKNIIREQSKAVSDSVERLGKDIAGVLTLSMQEMTKNIESNLETINSHADSFLEPVTFWKSTIEKANELQTNLNTSYDKINSSSSNLENTAKLLTKTMFEQIEYLVNYSESIFAQIGELSDITGNLDKNNLKSVEVIHGLKSNLNYIKENQDVLDKTLQSYELTLEKLVANIGEGFGSIVQFHMESAYKSFDDTIQENINKISRSNNEIALKMEALFGELSVQSKNETQAIVRIYEQLEMLKS